MLDAGAATDAMLLSGRNPFAIARATVAEDIVFVCLSNATLPFAQFIGTKLSGWISH